MALTKQQVKSLQGVIGVIFVVLGFTLSIPLFLKNMIGLTLATLVLIIAGIILMALAFSD